MWQVWTRWRAFLNIWVCRNANMTLVKANVVKFLGLYSGVSSLARKPRFHNCNLQFSTKSRTKASFSQLQPVVFERSLAQNAFLRKSGCSGSYVLLDKTCLGRWMGKVCRTTVAWRSRLGWAWIRCGSATQRNLRFSSFCLLQLAASFRSGCVNVALLCCCACSSMVFCRSPLPFRTGVVASIVFGRI